MDQGFFLDFCPSVKQEEKLCQILGTISVNNMEKSEVKMASPNHLHNVSRKPLNVQYT